MNKPLTDHAQLALRDALDVASEACTEFEVVVEELTEVSEREGRGAEWKTVITALKRAGTSARKAAEAASELIGLIV